jgi:radical SAM protein with 4Fe4S-binding SPASM domain
MSKPFFCTKPWTNFLILDHKGNVHPCCWSKVVCGNINTKSMEEIWNGKSFTYVRRKMASGDVDAICASDCPYLNGRPLIEPVPPTSNPALDNWLLQQQELASRQIVLESKPTIMRVVPTVDCNLTCVMCFQDRNDTVVIPQNTEEMLEAYYPTLQELLVIGGEPLLNRRCLRIIESIDPEKYPDLRLALITNGTVITDKVYDLILSKRISWIVVSLDAATPETYTQIRGGVLEKALEGIKKLKQIREQQHDSWSIVITFVLMRSNVHEITQFADLAEDLGVEFNINPVFGDWHQENFSTEPEQLAELEAAISNFELHLARKGLDPVEGIRLRAWLEDLKA